MKDNKARKLDTLIALFQKQSYQELEHQLSLFLQEDPENKDALNLLGLMEKKKGNLSKSQSIFESLCEIHPEVPGFLSNLGNLTLMQGDPTTAIAFLKKAIKLKPNTGLLERILQTLGIAQRSLGLQDDSFTSFEAGRALNGALQDNFNYEIANFYRTQEQYLKAITAFEGIDIHLSRTHQLDCIYRTQNNPLFHKKLKTLLADQKSNPLIGALVSHTNHISNTAVSNPFCNKPLNYIFKGNIPAHRLNIKLIKSLVEFSANPTGGFLHQDLLNNGKQSNGNLLNSGKAFVLPVEKIIRACITQYRKKFAKSTEGFLIKWPTSFKIYAWLVNIKSSGNLKSHMHKEGWLSGVIYLQIPKNLKNNEGSISFSLDGADLPNHNVAFPETIVSVEDRSVVMFPSSLFHKTCEFKNDKDRVSLAFDIIPDNLG